MENPRDEGAWWAAVYGITQSPTRLKRLSTHAPTILPLGPFISSGQYQTLKAFSEA